MKRPPLAAAALVGCLLAAPAAPAAADDPVTLRGKTSQGFPFSARIRDGRLTRLHFRWRARCRPRAVFRAYTTWLDGTERVIEQDGSKFSDSGTVRSRDRKRHQRTVRRERISGTFSGDMASLRGTHTASIRVRTRGGPTYRCHSSIRFSARR